MNNKFDILICGVGGQGILLCSNVIGNAAVEEEIPVKGVEVHGMAQRGGSVEAHIRLNCNYGPKIPYGKAELLIGFEPLEAARYSVYLKEKGICVVNSYKIPVLGQDYEEKEIIEIVRKKTEKIYIENFTEMAKEIGSVRVVNILMLGYTSYFIPLKKSSFMKSIKKLVKKEFIELNLKAFKTGELKLKNLTIPI